MDCVVPAAIRKLKAVLIGCGCRTLDGFDAYDLDGDGIIDSDEFIRSKIADTYDRKITRAEWIVKYGNDDGYDEYIKSGQAVLDANAFHYRYYSHCVKVANPATRIRGRREKFKGL